MSEGKKTDVAEMRMVRRMLGVTEMGGIRNERIRGTTNMMEVSK